MEIKPPHYPNNLAALYLLHSIEDWHSAKRAIENGKKSPTTGRKFWADLARKHRRSSHKWMKKYGNLVSKDIYYQGWGDDLVEVPLPQPERPDAA